MTGPELFAVSGGNPMVKPYLFTTYN